MPYVSLKGYPRIITNPVTKLNYTSFFPLTRKEAIAEKVAFYRPYPSGDEIKCDDCGDTHSGVFYTIANIPTCCAMHEANEVYLSMKGLGEPLNPSAATKAGKDYYWRVAHGKYCGHIGMTTLAGKCYICEQERKGSPRQVALDKGESWYMPLEGRVCKRGHYALRRVVNGSCKKCEEETSALRREKLGVRKAPSKTFRAENTDLVISREEAKTAEMKLYRTGIPCRRGHTDWRYVSTGGCVACLGR